MAMVAFGVGITLVIEVVIPFAPWPCTLDQTSAANVPRDVIVLVPYVQTEAGIEAIDEARFETIDDEALDTTELVSALIVAYSEEEAVPRAELVFALTALVTPAVAVFVFALIFEASDVEAARTVASVCELTAVVIPEV